MAEQNGSNLSNRISANYHPGSQSFPSLCVTAGDRFIHKLTTWKAYVNGVSNIVKDAAGYLPIMAYYPSYDREADPTRNDPRTGQRATHAGWVFGNDNDPPCIRMDIGSFFCRWGGNIQIEGGGGAGGEVGDASDLVVTWLWDRAWAQKEVRVMTDTQGLITNTLTFWNVGGVDLDGHPVRIPRPVCAVRVWTPDDITITGDFAPGGALSATNAPINERHAKPVPCGPWLYFSTAAQVGCLIFEIDY